MEPSTYGGPGGDGPDRAASSLTFVPPLKWLSNFRGSGIAAPDTPKPAAPDPLLSHEGEIDFYSQCLALPWCRHGGVLVVAAADSAPATLARLKRRYGAAARLLPITKPVLLRALEERFAGKLLDRATNSLARRFPELSARRVMTTGQACVLLALPVGIAAAFYAVPAITNLLLALAMGTAFIANILFRAILVWTGAGGCGAPAAQMLRSGDLPLYSIIVPLYREANVIPGLVAALSALDYPAGRIEIVLAMEADDCETIAAAKMHAVDPRFVLLRVPPGLPRTKPKAANYALGFVRGEFTVIYDAEDRPEPDQLLKAVAAFRNLSPSVACLQARLNFYNAGENWLTRMFALDYALWFDFLLPGLDKFGIPMPLGGTSNHFRTDALRAIEGWDPYNVTEDADLGIRLARLGLRVTTLDSTTYEEATVALGDWLRQRSRWMKGYMQTWLVHMRRPIRLLRRAGIGGFLGFQLFVGGTFLTALLNPVLWALCLCSWIFGNEFPAGFAAAPFAHASLLGLIAGNRLFTYLAMLGPCRRGWFDLTPYGFAAPLYWALISAACYRGLWHLAAKPQHWEKTRHGMSCQSPRPFASTGGDA